MPAPVSWIARAVVAIAALAAASQAGAHGAMAGSNALIAGLAHPLTALEHILPLIALGMLAGQRGLIAGQGLLVVFPIAFAAGAIGGAVATGLPELTAINAATALIAGGLVALALALPRTLLYGIVVAIGAIHGLANGGAGGEGLALFIAGSTLAATLVFAYAFGLTHHALKRATPWLPVAVRAIGSWIAAFGILTLALASLPAAMAVAAAP